MAIILNSQLIRMLKHKTTIIHSITLALQLHWKLEHRKMPNNIFSFHIECSVGILLERNNTSDHGMFLITCENATKFKSDLQICICICSRIECFLKANLSKCSIEPSVKSNLVEFCLQGKHSHITSRIDKKYNRTICAQHGIHTCSSGHC